MRSAKVRESKQRTHTINTHEHTRSFANLCPRVSDAAMGGKEQARATTRKLNILSSSPVLEKAVVEKEWRGFYQTKTQFFTRSRTRAYYVALQCSEKPNGACGQGLRLQDPGFYGSGVPKAFEPVCLALPQAPLSMAWPDAAIMLHGLSD